MSPVDAIMAGLNLILDLQVVLYIILGMTIGILVGAIPGISGIIAVSIMLIPSFYLSPVHAIVFLTSIYTGSIYGGGITAILLNIPGAPGAVATGFDGYAMTKAGHYNESLGVGLASSVVGCITGYFYVLLLFIPIASLVLSFGPPEMLMIVLFAFTI
ncbi:MAG: tripartite tricarboxylate transporter permease, partial [Firmicutes bacterium]|nr:tripartite tricarboxylate transporter permease [Bacillota bacterium]